jgi:hypothetical protein
MRANEIIRNVLNLLDQIDCQKNQPAQIAITGHIVAEPAVPTEEPISPELKQDNEHRRFKQIMDILATKDRNTMYSNSPNEMISNPSSVTTDAGLQGVHPEDIRADSISMYPGFQARPVFNAK